MNRILIHTLMFALLMPQSALGFNRSRLDQIAGELADYRDRSASEYAAETLLDRADYEAEQIIDLVRTEVRFQPYAGVLRGPSGTLRSRAGNANDQAVTLASLLNDAGYEAQVVQGSLSEAEANRLLSEFRPGKGGHHASEAEPPAFVREIAEVVRPHAVNLPELQAETADYALGLWSESKADRLIDSITTVQQALIEEARDYRWVRYRDGAADPWVDVHPVFATTPEDWRPRVQTVESGSVAAQALHTVTLQLFMRRDGAGEGSETVPVTDRLVYTAANLEGAPITLEIGSDASAGAAPDQAFDQVIEESFLFYPLVNGGVPEGLKVFDLNGRTYPAAALEGLKGVFETVGRKMDKANSQLADLGGSAGQKAGTEGGSALQSVWVELGYEVPGAGEKRRVERVLYSRERTSPAAAQLLQSWSIDVSTASSIPAYYESELAGLGVEVLQGYREYADYLARNPNMTDAQKLKAYAYFLPSQDRSRLIQLRQAFAGFDAGDVDNYAHVPQLIAIRRGFDQHDGVWRNYELVDILTNSRRSLGAGDLPVPDALVGFTRGVWETRMEQVGRSSAFPTSTVSAFSLLEKRGEWVASMQEGALVLDPADDGKADVWWTLDPKTGSAVGMLATPWGVAGSDATSYVVNVTLIGISVLLAGAGAYTCSRQAGNNVECCIATNVLLLTIGLITGWSAGLIGVALVGVEAGAAASVIAGTATDIVGLGIPIDCSAT